ncbi:MAG: tetratricopeptide repeat protein [Rhizomicrobium sp.]
MVRQHILITAILFGIVAVVSLSAEAKPPAAGQALLSEAQTELAGKNWQQAADTLNKLIALDPRWDYYQMLGGAELNLGQYQEAVDTFDKGIAVVQADKKIPRAKLHAALAQMLTNKGNAFLKLKRNDEAVAAFKDAAGYSANPGTAWFNICATEYNIGDTADAVATCDKAIAADPKKADAYFIKGSLMFANGVLDKDNNYVAPAGTIEALKKYLELAPDGAHSGDVHQMLDYLNKPTKP